MAKNDTRNVIVDKLEVFSVEHGLKFIWAIERRPDGCLTVQFTKDHFRHTYRITNKEIEAAKGDPDIIVKNIMNMVTNAL